MNKKILFPNLAAEESRKALTDEEISKKIGISRTSYNTKKRTGNFKLSEIVLLCNIFNAEFSYLFYMEQKKAGGKRA